MPKSEYANDKEERKDDIVSSIKSQLQSALDAVNAKIESLGSGGAANAKKKLEGRKAQIEQQLRDAGA